MADKGLKRCNFCGKPENQVRNMFSAEKCNICDECVTYCYELLMGPLAKTKQSRKSSTKSKTDDDTEINLLTPAQIKAVLDEYVVGSLLL